jgi:hypothetical protein
MREMNVYIPLRLPSLLNSRMHWRALARIKKQQRDAVAMALSVRKPLPPLPATVTFTRIGKRMLDSDNLQGAFKAARDQVADMMGVDDGSPLWEWRYEQRTGKEYGIEIEIEPR